MLLIRKISAVACIVILPYVFFAQMPGISLSETVGVDSKRLDVLDQYITAMVDEKAIPGGSFIIARMGQVVFEKSYGYNSTDGLDSYDDNDIYRLASMTKAITSVAVMQLYERGKIGLDDPIHYYIPAFKSTAVLSEFNEADTSYWTVPVEKPITIRHLLTHSSGIVYGDFNPGKLGMIYTKHEMTGVGLYHESWTTEEFVNRLAKVPLAFQPGEKFTYGLNMDVLGHLVEVVSGMELDDYFSENIFSPLGMNDTYFHVPKEKHNRIVPVYSYDKNGNFVMAESIGLSGNAEYPKLKDNNFYAGGGGLSGTARDYLKFIMALENNGKYNGYQLLARKTIETMTADQFVKLNKEGNGISQIPGITHNLGFMLIEEEAEGQDSKSVGTYQWGGYFNTKYFIDPKEDLVFVGMTQIVPFNRPDFWDKLYAILYASLID